MDFIGFPSEFYGATQTNGTIGNTNNYFYSDIIQDEFSVFNKVLSSSEVSTLYNSGVPTDVTEISGCQGWWRNGDPTVTGAYPTISDDSANSNDGTMTNMASNDIITDVP